MRREKIKKAKDIIMKAEASDSAWQESALSARVADVFIRFQEDWSNYNAEAMKEYCVPSRRFLWNFAPRGLRHIKTESNDFNKKFCLYAHPSDQINSFVLLAPDFMEEVYNLPFELNIEIVGSFLYFYVKGRKNVNEDEMMRLLSRAFDSMRSS